MSKTSISDKPTGDERKPRHLLHYLVFGLIAGATVIAVTLVEPPPVVVVPLVVSAALVKLLDFIAHRYAKSPFSTRLDRTGIVYLSILIVATIGTLAVVWFVARMENKLWLMWPAAGLMFVVVFMGAWLTEERPSHKTPSAV